MSAIRRDASRARLLITARIDPTDSEEWQAILDPPTDDYGLERSAAARLVGLLAGVAREAGELHSPPAVSSPPSLIEAHLVAAGWTRGSIETTLRGRPIAELFARLAPQLRAVTAKCQPWLVGGWLDRETAAALATELDRAIAELERVRGSVVSKLARGTAFSGRRSTRASTPRRRICTRCSNNRIGNTTSGSLRIDVSNTTEFGRADGNASSIAEATWPPQVCGKRVRGGWLASRGVHGCGVSRSLSDLPSRGGQLPPPQADGPRHLPSIDRDHLRKESMRCGSPCSHLAHDGTTPDGTG
jgi:hypothetical protein